MEPVTVTVALATYNRAGGYLREALASAAAQTYPHVEILVSDNHSTDDTEAVVRSVRDPRVRYLRQPRNLGANGNFNACLQAARGEYFVLLHDDDVLEPDMVERCVEALAGRRDVGVVLTGTRILDAEGTTLKERLTPPSRIDDANFVLRWLEGEVPLYLCSTMYNTALLRRSGGFASPGNLYDDVAATLTVMLRHGRVCVPRIEAGFRRHVEQRGSGQPIRAWIDDAVHLDGLIGRELPGITPALQRSVRAHLARKTMARIDAMGGPLERLRWAAYAYRAFGYRYGPWRYLLWKLRDRMRSLRRGVAYRLRVASTGREAA